MRSAPTTTAWILPARIRLAAMLSQITVVGMPSAISSHAVSRAPCKKGPRLVGVNMNLLALLHRRADHAQRRAIAARRQRSGVAVGQHAAFVRQQRAAKRAHRLAGRNVFVVHRVRLGENFFLICVNGLRPSPADAANSRFMRSIAQNRFTAVGRVPASRAQICLELRRELLARVAALLRIAPRATP